MSGKIETNRTTVGTTAAYVITGSRDWAEIANYGTVDVYGKYDAVATDSNYDFIISPNFAKTWDEGLDNRVSLVTASGTAICSVESN